MERQSSLRCLPFEVLVQIASHLTIQDILACCATSSLMRDAFNDDLLWKRHVNLKLAHYLKQRECLVEPFFVWVDEDSALSPICDWRKNYMMQVHLYNNWRHGIYEMEKFVFEPDNVTIATNTKFLFYDSDYLFINTEHVFEDKMLHDIWDVKDTPSHHSTLTVNFHDYAHSEVPYCLSGIKIVDNKLVVVENNLVLIYDILSPQPHLQLDYAFTFNAHEKVSKVEMKSDKNPFSKIEPKVKTIIAGNYLIGTIESSHHPVTLNIWNIQTGGKVREEYIPSNKNIEVASIQFLGSQTKKDVIVKLCMIKDRHMYHYYGYDLAQLMYSSFVVKLNYCDFVIFTGDYVAGVGSQKFFLYSYKTSEKLLMMNTNHEILKRSLTVLRDNLLFGTFDNTIYVLNLSNRSIINCVKLGFTLYSLQAFGNKFVVINTLNSEVWEIGQTAKKLFELPSNGSFVAVNKLCTKLLILKASKLIILNFW